MKNGKYIQIMTKWPNNDKNNQDNQIMIKVSSLNDKIWQVTHEKRWN